uniref:Uncharacterized protein n=1 Tax=Cucumis melo TaxID=3656 RepID=A0A9I9EKD7_CUCME
MPGCRMPKRSLALFEVRGKKKIVLSLVFSKLSLIVDRRRRKNSLRSRKTSPFYRLQWSTLGFVRIHWSSEAIFAAID